MRPNNACMRASCLLAPSSTGGLAQAVLAGTPAAYLVVYMYLWQDSSVVECSICLMVPLCMIMMLIVILFIVFCISMGC